MNLATSSGLAPTNPTVFTPDDLNDLIINSIQDVKGINVVKLDLRTLHDAPVDYFIVCEGESRVQVKAIANNIMSRLKHEARTIPSNKEGMQNANWICLDYFYTIVHVFYKETRQFFQLEDLWSDAKVIEYEDL